jgi:hypothetical protein
MQMDEYSVYLAAGSGAARAAGGGGGGGGAVETGGNSKKDDFEKWKGPKGGKDGELPSGVQVC